MNRPVILLGNGVRGNPALIAHLCSLNIPILTTWPACDLIAEDHPAFCGRPGIIGQRAANIIQQKATHLFVFGARLDEQQVNYNYANFAPEASIIVYDVDYCELSKLPTHWGKYQVSLTEVFLHELPPMVGNPAWLSWCKALYARFRPELDGKPAADGYVDPFAFISALSDACQPDDVLAIGSSGGAPCSFLQAFKVKRGQRITNVSTIGAMGADIPMAIGACIASGRRRTVCVTGDGGFQMNAQELEVVRRLNLPISFFVYNNSGYGSIRNMQNGRFSGRHVACDEESGLTLPPLRLMAATYDIGYKRIDHRTAAWKFHIDDLPDILHFGNNGPQIVELMIDPAWQQYPRCITRLVDGKFEQMPMQFMAPEIPPSEMDLIMAWGNEAERAKGYRVERWD